MVSYDELNKIRKAAGLVLILIVVEDGLVLMKDFKATTKQLEVLILIVVEDGLVPLILQHSMQKASCLNPYCSGRWSRTVLLVSSTKQTDNSLNPYCSGRWSRTATNGFAHGKRKMSLNPYCSGRWSRTRPYKTILIINKLKNSTKQSFTFLN